MSEDPLFKWALEAAKLRFGPEVTLVSDYGYETPCAIYTTGESPKLLGAAKTWPEAVVQAVKDNEHIPQPALVVLDPEPAPEGEEFIKEFVGALRRRDLLSEFLLWYGEQHDRDPRAFPRALYRSEWLETFGEFILAELE